MVRKYSNGRGWFSESERHSLSARGIRTGRGGGSARIGIHYATEVVPLPTDIREIKSTRYVGGDFEFTFQPIEGSLSITKAPDGGYVAKYLVRDENAESPDTLGDKGLFLVHYHRDFDVRKNDVITEDDARAWYQGEDIPQEKDYWILPVEAYIHSGVALAISKEGNFPDRRWDVSNVGLVLADKKEFKTKAKAEKAMRGLVETWNEYLSGDVYGVVADKYDKDKKLVDNESVWGYYGEKYAMEELKGFNPDFSARVPAGQKKITQYSKRSDIRKKILREPTAPYELPTMLLPKKVIDAEVERRMRYH
jgi:hypothetical protein